MKDDIAVDWNEVWKRRLALNRSTRNFREGADLWGDREQARRYAARSEADHARRIAWTLQDLGVSPGDRVLDIGSGPGTLALPLARAGARVTAVDPAEGMLAELRAAAEREGLTGIATVRGLWEELDPDRDLAPPYDRVVASFSLVMPDIRSALAAMDAVVSESGSVHLYWFADEPPWEQFHSRSGKTCTGRRTPKAEGRLSLQRPLRHGDLRKRPDAPDGREDSLATVEDAVDHFAPG